MKVCHRSIRSHFIHQLSLLSSFYQFNYESVFDLTMNWVNSLFGEPPVYATIRPTAVKVTRKCHFSEKKTFAEKQEKVNAILSCIEQAVKWKINWCLWSLVRDFVRWVELCLRFWIRPFAPSTGTTRIRQQLSAFESTRWRSSTIQRSSRRQIPFCQRSQYYSVFARPRRCPS